MSDFKNKLDETGGKIKEGFGEATGNEKLADEGRADQTKAQAKDAIEDAGEAVKDAGDKILGSFQDRDK